MRRPLTAVVLAILGALTASAWTPADLFKGKTGRRVSGAALAIAQHFDWSSSLRAETIGAGCEKNALYRKPGERCHLDIHKFSIWKLGISLGATVGEEGVFRAFRINANKNANAIATGVNWGFAGVTAGFAVGNRVVIYKFEKSLATQ